MMPDLGAEPIDRALAHRLDAFTVPALPDGFADRLVAAALAEGQGGAPLPQLRRPATRRWLRGGIAGLGTLAVGMISISAAAMGYLGEPFRHAVSEAPVIGAVVERVIPKALRQPKKAAAVKLAKPAVPKSVPVASAPAIEEAQPAPGLAPRLTPMERRARVREIMADPEQRRAWIAAHPQAAQRMIRRAEIRRQRIEAGIAPPPGADARLRRLPALQGPVRAMPGPMRRERLERLRERRRLRMEMRGMAQEPAGEAQPPEVQP